MTISRQISDAGLTLIKRFEGFSERAIRLPDGRWMVGYGHVKTAREGVRIKEEDALHLLKYDLRPVEDALQNFVFTPLNQNQYDALASFVFNISPGLFQQSEVLRCLNKGDHLAAAAAFDYWRKARVNGELTLVDALVRRRAAEKALFLEPVDGVARAATALVAPQLDVSTLNAAETDVSAPRGDTSQHENMQLMNDAIESMIAGHKLAEEASEDEQVLSRMYASAVVPEEDNQADAVLSSEDADILSEIGAEIDDEPEGDVVQDFDDTLEALEVPADEPVEADEELEITPIAQPAAALTAFQEDRLVANDDDMPTETDVTVQASQDDRDDETLEDVVTDLLNKPEDTKVVSEPHKTPQQAADAVAARLARIFEPKTDTQKPVVTPEAPKSEDSSEEAVDQKVGIGEKFVEDVSSYDDPKVENLVEELTATDSEQEAIPDSQSADAWKLSEQLNQDPAYMAFLTTEGKTAKKPKAQEETLHDPLLEEPFEESQAEAFREETEEKTPLLWKVMMFFAGVTIIWGILDFYTKSRPDAGAGEISFGPMLIAVGVLIFIMSAYFLLTRKND